MKLFRMESIYQWLYKDFRSIRECDIYVVESLIDRQFEQSADGINNTNECLQIEESKSQKIRDFYLTKLCRTRAIGMMIAQTNNNHDGKTLKGGFGW